MSWTEARKGQRAVEMSCACHGAPVLVRADYADKWRCGNCHKGWPSGRTLTLQRGGSLPPPEPEIQLTAAHLRSLRDRRAS